MTSDPKSIPQINELLYTMKLKNGDEVLFTMIDDTDDGLVIESPIKVSVYTYVEDGHLNSNLVTQKWIMFSTDDIFFVPHEDIITYHSMAESAHMLYVNAVNRYTETDSDNESDSFIMEPSNTIQ